LRPKGEIGKQVMSDPSRADRAIGAVRRKRWADDGRPPFRRAGKRVTTPGIDGKPGKSVASPPQRISFVSLAWKRTIE
jgi:hypothetical protein